MLDQLKQAIRIYLDICGPSPELSVMLLKLIDLIERPDQDETTKLAYQIIKAVADNIMALIQSDPNGQDIYSDMESVVKTAALSKDRSQSILLLLATLKINIPRVAALRNVTYLLNNL